VFDAVALVDALPTNHIGAFNKIVLMRGNINITKQFFNFYISFARNKVACLKNLTARFFLHSQEKSLLL
jgi:hypothetical protein